MIIHARRRDQLSLPRASFRVPQVDALERDRRESFARFTVRRIGRRRTRQVTHRTGGIARTRGDNAPGRRLFVPEVRFDHVASSSSERLARARRRVTTDATPKKCRSVFEALSLITLFVHVMCETTRWRRRWRRRARTRRIDSIWIRAHHDGLSSIGSAGVFDALARSLTRAKDFKTSAERSHGVGVGVVSLPVLLRGERVERARPR